MTEQLYNNNHQFNTYNEAVTNFNDDATNLNNSNLDNDKETNINGEVMGEVDIDTSFLVEFHDAFSYKNLLKLLKATGEMGANWVFSKAGIELQQTNADVTILTQVFIWGDKLCEYEFNSKKEVFFQGCCYNDTCPQIEGIGKKDRMKMYMMPQQRQIYFNIIKRGSESEGNVNLTSILPKQLPQRIYTVDELGSFSKPIKVVTTNNFKTMCEKMISTKSKYIKVQCTETSVIFKAQLNQGITKSEYRFGTDPNYKKRTNIYTDTFFNNNGIIRPNGPTPIPDIIPEGVTHEHTISAATLKSLSILNNLCPQGTIKIFINENAIKLEADIGNYGEIELYIRSCQIN